MFRKKTNTATTIPDRDRSKSLSQYGLLDIPDINPYSDANIDEEDDAMLEAELNSIIGNDKPVRRKPKARPVAVPDHVLGKMVEESLKDLSDTDISSGDENDPELLEEFNQLTANEADYEEPEVPAQKVHSARTNEINYGVVLDERLKMYELAAKNAKTVGDESKLRRIGRGIRTIQDLKKQFSAGKRIDENDIPPVVATGTSKYSSSSQPIEPPPSNQPSAEVADNTVVEKEALPPPIPPRSVKHEKPLPCLVSIDTSSPSPEKKSKPNETDAEMTQDTVVQLLIERQDLYKKSALDAKHNGNMEMALDYVKIVKQFDIVINGAKNGKPVDLNSIPPPPVPPNTTSDQRHVTAPLRRQESEKQNSGHDTTTVTEEPNTMPTPKTVLEALERRMLKFKEIEQKAKEENNSRKARQTGRIISSYQDAIRLHKAGKPFDVESLPTPLGEPPLPVIQGSTVEKSGDQPVPSKRLPNPEESSTPSKARVPKQSENADTNGEDKPFNAKIGATSRSEAQTKLLRERQKLFKTAALMAKQKGEMEHAKEYLRQSKQIQSLIEASECGLPVDMNTIPVPPSDKIMLEADFDVVTLNNCVPGSDTEVFEKLESDLSHQLEMCFKTRDHFKAVGDIASSNRFEQLAVRSKNDLLSIQLARSRNKPVPKFHYETKPFSIIQCNTDLTDNDLEVSIGQGISYNVPNPKEIDTYIKLTFPYPTEAPQQYKTSIVYNTNNPSYNAVHSFQIQRNARACQRIFKRQSLKCEVWSKGGFFRSDSLVGTATVKLLPLETQCTIHDAFDIRGNVYYSYHILWTPLIRITLGPAQSDPYNRLILIGSGKKLMEGRKMVGGKLEVKIRIRNPILMKQVEQVQQKWLIIDI